MTKATLKETTIEVSGPTEAVESTHYYIQVGRALTTWAITESVLSEFYCMLVCGKNTPADGAITTFSELRSFDERKGLISKCLDQVLYPNEFNTFRKSAKKRLNRIQTLSQIRNKIAHGAVLKHHEVGRILFYTYYMDATDHRQRGLAKMHGGPPSIVKNPIKWDLSELAQKAKSLEEAHALAKDLVSELSEQYKENSELLKGTARMLLRPGLPYRGLPEDQTQPDKIRQQQEPQA